MKYDIFITNSFKKDLKKATRQGKNINLLFKIIDQLSEGKALDPKYKDHKLHGKFEGQRECHIAPDFLLVYQKNEKLIKLILLYLGSHSDIFR